MLTAPERLRRRAAQPRLVALARALSRLKSSVTVMNTGAHPDDEHNEMLAAMRHEMGMRIIVACSTRGEGGQNTLGPERGGALGVLRSREMEEAARALDADIAWLGHGPDDPVHDFGFSKSGKDTLARWGEERIIDRLVRVYRQFRPDIVIPTFLDVLGQHGHHRAMTEAAERALALAADPAYETENLAPWTVTKFCLPAWSGGGDTYDDEVPPPRANLFVTATGSDFATGMPFWRLGEVSRAFHASQNMGHWRHPGETTWPLHQVGTDARGELLDELPKSLSDLGPSPYLAAADAALAQAIAAFPDSTAILPALSIARRAIRGAQEDIAPEHAHRLERKLEELDAATAIAAGIEIYASVSSASIAPGEEVDLTIEAEPGEAANIRVTPITSGAFLPTDAVSLSGDSATVELKARADAKIENAFRPDWQNLNGNGNVSVRIEAEVNGEVIRFFRDTEEDLQLAAAYTVAITPEALILPLSAPVAKTVALKTDIDFGRVTIPSAPSLTIERHDKGFRVTSDILLTAARHSLPLLVDGTPAFGVTPIAYPHIGRTHFARPLSLDILALNLTVPDTKIGYIGGGSDRVGLWLNRMGANVTELDTEALADDISAYDTIVIGIFAFGLRPDLRAATQKLHRWVEAGGHLVTLYHRPSDGWTADETPPRPITIGSPSLRWRTTNPAAEVKFLYPEHKLLTGPNRITADDFAGWDKERGLYFASAWDSAYVPLLAMSDAGEEPLTGSLLSAEIGRGRHTHTSLVLHHQLEKLVPGAFRLMANLLQSA
ncbi:PIG-L family deacetylase [Devosia sp. BK]|uniref:PIG-L family deacetylase n=1 Tax=Devosia sp. BK TaxID=2871706 RepID=UPI002939C517|nr:PIG-L family deacetylase [Devosia sp. BK]MDV3253655.1 PIG-L family deacetylase [Devosia sp. BK]